MEEKKYVKGGSKEKKKKLMGDIQTACIQALDNYIFFIISV